MRDGRSSAVAATAAELGCSAAHTGAPAAEDPALGDLLRDFEGELDLFAESAIAPPARRGPGRPPGSPNRSTLQLRKLLLARGYRDPAEFLASIVSADALELAATLGVKDKLEVVKLQRQAATDLMPYFHQRLPQEADQKPAEARPLVVVMTGDAAAVRRREDGTLSVYDIEGNQALSEPGDSRSHNGKSHEEAK